MFDGPLSKTLFYIVGFCFFVETIFLVLPEYKDEEEERRWKKQDENFAELFSQPGPSRLQINAAHKAKFSDMYQPSELQKHGELLFAGGGALVLGYAAFRFL